MTKGHLSDVIPGQNDLQVPLITLRASVNGRKIPRREPKSKLFHHSFYIKYDLIKCALLMHKEKLKTDESSKQKEICSGIYELVTLRIHNKSMEVLWHVQYIPRNMHTVFALLCFVVVIHWLIFPYPSGLLHWHSGNLTIAPVPAKQPWWIWINTSCEFILNDSITTTKQSTTKPCAYFLGYTV